ncbi:Coq4 family protein [Sphingomonas sp. BAUL-RG-20F-R05-02]|uniref:Coq4 family protein n=1 Tax=Sphingomonas sp. BAUL-RG-20F-R05-02 TaxID=2914830 RepID=UPI001F5A5894|nr:Coq4 family protein [Sphingomonas sp. BAUL-RG-20F-R05-02]
MTNDQPATDMSSRENWHGAFAALRRLLADANDTAQVFQIMRALNGGTAKAGYDRLLRSAEGGRIAYQRVELAERFSDPDFLSRFPPGSIGAAYADFLRKTGYSAQGLVAISRAGGSEQAVEHPYAWFGRRTRDVHDIWHILTGYRADDPLGEACLVAFSYAQTGGLGWALIAVGSALKARRGPLGKVGLAAIWQGYRNGRRAAWLQGEDYERLFSERLNTARDRLRIGVPTAYRIADELRARSRAHGSLQDTPVATNFR